MTDARNEQERRLRAALEALRAARERLEQLERERHAAIAVVGLGCRFPGGASSPLEFWQLLAEGTDAVGDVPTDRWDSERLSDPDPEAVGRIASRRGAFVEGLDRIDARFFGISPREARSVDPQQRLLLEVGWEALETAGLARTAAGSRGGVFVGVAPSDYLRLLERSGGLAAIDAYRLSGTAVNAAAGRLAYCFGLEGPAIAIDTACSSSLVAVHLACRSLRGGECDFALAGGVNVILAPEVSVTLSRNHMLAPDGRCKTFDARADGFVRGEGCGLVVLRRLEDARADGDPVLAVIRGTAVNQDGATSGFTVPNRHAQEALIEAALEDARLDPAAVDYVEAHGTGTSLGDPIELRALAGALGAGRAPDAPLLVGSVKTNLGHLESAAGIAGLVKVVLALQHGAIPPHLHLEEPTPLVDWSSLPVSVPTQTVRWPRGPRARVAGVSSFGASGTNAHVVVEESPPAAVEEREGPSLLLLSARSERALAELAARFAERLASADLPFAEVCAQVNGGRAAFDYRLAVVGASSSEASERLAAAVVAGRKAATAPRVAFLFTGQGSQYTGMGMSLYASEPVYREAFDRCDAFLHPLLGRPLRAIVEGGAEERDLLDRTRWTQPALFALGWSLAELWRSYGVVPAAALGHSVGEIVAACVTGALDLEDGLRLVAERGRLMEEFSPEGAMVAVAAGADVVENLVQGRADLALAAVNGPASTVLSGSASAVGEAVAALAAQGIVTKPLAVTRAFHSSLMEPALDALEEIAATIPSRPPSLPLVSNLSGRAFGADAPDARYWRGQARAPVRFAEGIASLEDLGCDVFLELGPAPVLLGMGRQCTRQADAAWLPSLRQGRDERAQLLASAGELFVRGCDLDWPALGPRAAGTRPWLDLPTYPFERERAWVDPGRARAEPAPPRDGHPLLGEGLRVAGREELVFAATVDETSLPLLGEHRVGGRPMLPLAACAEAALAAGRELLGVDCSVEDLVLSEPLPVDSAARLQAVASATGEGARFELYREGDDGGWRLHARATVRPLGSARMPVAATDSVEPTSSIDARTHYQALARRGLELTGRFEVVEHVEVGSGTVAATLVPPQSVQEETARYRIHPALLDGALQGAVWLLPEDDPERCYVPFALERLRVLDTAAGSVRSVIRYRGKAGAGVVVDCELHGEDGRTLASIEGLVLQPVAAGQRAQEAGKQLLYEVAWETAEPAAPLAAPLRWHVVADDDGVVGELRSVPLADADGVVYLPGPGTDAAEQYSRALALVQALADRPPERLMIVTTGAQDVGSADAVALEQAPLLGLGIAVQAERPELGCRLVDLDPAGTAPLAALAAELTVDRRDPVVALRDDACLVPRLVRAGGASDGAPALPGARWRLEPSPDGVLDGLTIVRAERGGPPGPREIEAEVEAAGLGFRDVLVALGTYPDGVAPLGTEFAGRVTAVGEDVSELEPGDEVLGVAVGSLSSHVVTPAGFAAHRPEGLPAAAAAALPSSFLTALYALERVAVLSAGERVLVHAGAGGAGMAAIQVALAAGAEVLATASSDEKRALVRELGALEVFDSRSDAFADGVLAATGGAGVDIVLNSLSGELAKAGLKALREGGRFLELGRRGVLTPAQAADLRPDVAYSLIDLLAAAEADPSLMPALLRRLLEQLSAGALRPLPVRTFEIESAVHAFRTMAHGAHTGRLVARCRRRPLAGGGTYLVTGGLGGLGLATGAWLADAGADRVVLAGRSGPDPAQAERIEEIRRGSAAVEIVQADVTHLDELAAVVDEIDRAGPPLVGVVHAAGTYGDALLEDDTPENAAAVLSPKLVGAWNLHLVTRDRPLDTFLLFSSAVALLGSSGQASYVAANAYLDALASYRRRLGLPALSVAWGPWAEVGRVAERDLASRYAGRGLRPLPSASALAALEAALSRPEPAAARVAVLDAHWDRVALTHPSAAPLLERVRREPQAGSPGAGAPSRARLQDLAPATRGPALRRLVAGHAALVLELPGPAALDPDEPFSELGLDSLMAVELRNRLNADLGLTHPLEVTAVFDHPSVTALTGELARRLGLGGPPAPEASETAPPDDLADLSEEAAEKLLLEELARER